MGRHCARSFHSKERRLRGRYRRVFRQKSRKIELAISAGEVALDLRLEEQEVQAESIQQVKLTQSPTAEVEPPSEKVFAKPSFFYRGIGYCSLSEAAFGVLLEYFIPGFDIISGKTFQVPLGNGRSADLKINDVIVEYHQVRLIPSRGKLGDYPSEQAFQEYLNLRRRFKRSPHKRRALERVTRRHLLHYYTLRRKKHVEASPWHQNCELVVASSPEEFYFLVLDRFSILELPPLEKFFQMFWNLVRTIAEQCQEKSCQDVPA